MNLKINSRKGQLRKLALTLLMITLVIGIAIASDLSGFTNINATNFYQSGNTVLDTSDEANLNVNSSQYWDALNSPADINAGDITDDGTYLITTGDTATGNYTFDTSTLHIDSTNNRVGIGTTSPESSFDVNGTFYTFEDSIGRYLTTAQVYIETNSNHNIYMERIRNTTAGVGIMTVKSRRNSTGGRIALEDEDGIMYLSGQAYNGTAYTPSLTSINYNVDAISGAEYGGRIIFLTKGTSDSATVERMRIDSTGNVGIGTSNPEQKFHVSGNETGVSYSHFSNVDNGSTSATALVFRLAQDDYTARTGGVIQVTKNQLWNSTASTRDSYMTFSVSGDGAATEKMRLDGKSGNLGIGTTSTPSQKLDVAGNINLSASNGIIYFDSGARIETNSTCLILYSPSGANKIEVCD